MTMNIPEIDDNTPPTEILRAGIAKANGPVSLACSFSLEDVAIIDIATKAGIPFGVFAIDTGRLHEETYEVADALVERYRLKIDWYFPQYEAVEQLVRTKGPYSFRESVENRLECCALRKVEPLSRALRGLTGWVTGMRREQSPTRTDLAAIELDTLNGGIVKINPLFHWSGADLEAYITDHRLPRNRLLSRGYCSIGCAPCTRAIQEGEDCRAGRWWWENPEHRECGLHRR